MHLIVTCLTRGGTLPRRFHHPAAATCRAGVQLPARQRLLVTGANLNPEVGQPHAEMDPLWSWQLEAALVN